MQGTVRGRVSGTDTARILDRDYGKGISKEAQNLSATATEGRSEVNQVPACHRDRVKRGRIPPIYAPGSHSLVTCTRAFMFDKVIRSCPYFHDSPHTMRLLLDTQRNDMRYTHVHCRFYIVCSLHSLLLMYGRRRVFKLW